MAFEDHLYEKEENAKGSPVVTLNRRKRGRPTTLGAFIGYVTALRGAGVVIIARAVANAPPLSYNPTIAKEHREHVTATIAVSRSIFRKL